MDKNIACVVLVTILILLVPLTLTLINPNASIYGGEGGGWDWMPGDFIVMGALLLITGLAINFVIKKFNKMPYMVILVAAIVIVFLLVWIELAVDAVSMALDYLL